MNSQHAAKLIKHNLVNTATNKIVKRNVLISKNDAWTLNQGYAFNRSVLRYVTT